MNRYERWSAEFKAALAESGMTAAEFVRRYRSLATGSEGFTDATVSKWLNPVHRAAPSPKTALRVANVFGRPATDMLRAAGHDDVADILAEDRSKPGAPAADAAPAHPVIGATMAMIRESGLPAPEQEALRETFEDELSGDLGLLQATIQRKINNLLREIERGESILENEGNGHPKRTA